MSNALLKGLGHQTLTVAGASIGLTVPDGAVRATILTDLADIRMSSDGTPAESTDPLVPNRTVINLMDHRYQLQDFFFIRDGSVSASLYITYFN